MKKKKILIIATNDLGKSGVPEVIMEIVRLLHSSYTFDVLITRNNTFYKDEFESYGGSVFTMFEKEPKNRLIRGFYKFFVLKNTIRKTMKKLSKNNYFAIHSFKDLEGGYYLKCARKLGITKRISHCSRYHTEPTKKLARLKKNLLKKSIFTNATKLVAISQSSGDSLFGSNHKFEILYNTFNESLYKFDDTPPFSNLIMIQIGTYLPIKNQLFSIEVLKNITTVLPNAKLFLIGRVFDETYYLEIKNKIHTYGLSKNVIMFDYNEDQNKLYAKTCFSLIPSINEGLSLTAIESQAKGIKCFASTGVPKEVSCGNIVFLELDAKKWANEIIDCFYKTKGMRNKVDMNKFSNLVFKNKLEQIYEN